MSIIAETQVKYNKSGRVWETWDNRHDYNEALIVGGVTAFPAGKEGKRGALIAALKNDAPEIAAEVEAIIKNQPLLVDRAIKGGYLVARGHVYAPLPMSSPYSYLGECARVESQTEPGTFYAVSEHPAEMWCNCPDHENGVKRQILNRDHPQRPRFGAPFIPKIGLACKHILAWLICCALADNEPELEDMEIPF